MIAGLRFPRRAAQPGGELPPADGAALPADLMLALETATVVLRAADPDEIRAVVQMGDSGFMAADAHAQLLKRFPELTPAQLQRAVRAVSNLVRRAAKETTQARKNWATSW